MACVRGPRDGGLMPRRKRRHRSTFLIALAGLSFLFSMVLGILGPELIPTESYRADSYSPSSVGFQALVEVLEALELPVTVSTWSSGTRAAEGGVLILGIPEASTHSGAVLRDEQGQPVSVGHHVRSVLAKASISVVVLPKYRPRGAADNPDWVVGVDPVAVEWVAANVRECGLAIPDVVRLAADTMGTGWETGGLGPLPSIPGCQLLAHGRGLDPIVDCDGGVLIGEIDGPGGKRVVLVSDPDLLNTHGLAHAENASLAVRLIEHLRRDGGIVVDEVVHGYGRRPSFWRHVLRLPYLLLPLHALLLLAGLLWAGADRFGSPRGEVRSITPGHHELIRNTASLMRASGGSHSTSVLAHYAQGRIGHLRHRFAIPESVRGKALTARLDTIGAARGTRESWSALDSALASYARTREDPHTTLDLAARIHAWTQEMIDGSDNRS